MDLKEIIQHVETFHNAFHIANYNVPTLLNDKEAELRYNLMKEENEEYLEAAKNGDMIEIADALGDQLYILLGTMLVHGMQDKIEEVFDEIHQSNMSKLGEDGKPIYREDGKVLKGPNYSPADISKSMRV